MDVNHPLSPPISNYTSYFGICICNGMMKCVGNILTYEDHSDLIGHFYAYTDIFLYYVPAEANIIQGILIGSYCT